MSNIVLVLTYFYIKAIEHFFRVYIASSKRSEGWVGFTKVLETLDSVSGLHNCLEFSQPSSSLDEAM